MILRSLQLQTLKGQKPRGEQVLVMGFALVLLLIVALILLPRFITWR